MNTFSPARLLTHSLSQALPAIRLLLIAALLSLATSPSHASDEPRTANALAAQAEQFFDLTLIIEGYREAGGTSYISVHPNAASFKDSTLPATSLIKQQLTAKTMKITLHQLPAGEYALRMFHDENGSGDMDTNILGIPTEPYAFSNNAGRFGPPSFNDAKIVLSSATVARIQLR